jgi:8-oxo-dGTP pyrophosphatase MutT (NUDIX family)
MEQRRRAAVVIAIFRTTPHGVIFVDRAAHLRDHPGQIALPGGGVHPEDDGLAATALRELREEVGISAERVTIVAELPLLRQRVANNFDVTPFVAIVEAGAITIDPSETAGVFMVPLARTVEQGLQETVVRHGDVEIQSLVLDYEGRRIWGLTARILHSFVESWKGSLSSVVNEALNARRDST